MYRSPELVQKRFHHVPLGFVDIVRDFNEAAEEDEKFDGIRLDNEPQVLPVWHHTKRRPEILREFLELNEFSSTRALTEEPATPIRNVVLPPTGPGY